MSHAAEAELSRLAQTAVLEHGVDAPTFARHMAAERLRKVDLDGAHRWCVVSRRAEHLLNRMSLAHH